MGNLWLGRACRACHGVERVAMGTITGPGLMWKDLSIQTIEAYLALPDAQRRIDFVRSNCLEGLPANVITNPERVNIVLDLYYYTLQFGIEQAFTFDKLSALFSIMKATFLESMAQFLPAKAAFNYFRDLLLQHSVQRPPTASACSRCRMSPPSPTLPHAPSSATTCCTSTASRR